MGQQQALLRIPAVSLAGQLDGRDFNLLTPGFLETNLTHVNPNYGTESNFFIPDSVYLSADVTLSGNANDTGVNNLGRNLISKLAVKWGTETII
jgi:hypothetical protein